MTNAEAIEICQQWFAYLQRQKEKAEKMAALARKARRSPEDAEEARREMRRMDKNLSVYDGGRLEPAVRHLVEKALKGAPE